MDMKTRYLGLELKNPLVASASPINLDLDAARRSEDAGAAALVMPSLFEEQILAESRELDHYLTHGTESFAEALSYFPEQEDYRLGPERYLQTLRRLKASLDIPVIASLNGVSEGGWTAYARHLEEAGADAIELNVYFIPTDPNLSGREVEQIYVDVLTRVKASVSIPVAMKLSPFFSNMAEMAHRLDQAGADGLVLFNRFYQPDLDLDELVVRPNILLSTPQAMRLPLRWIAILHGHLKASLAATSGVHTTTDCLKMLMAGADAVMLASAVFRHGPEVFGELLEGVRSWMEEREYESVEQLKGSMSQKSVAEPAAYERALYVQALQRFDGRSL
ncbi:MAG: dihydroorotate dehydrogenase-like protein [Candidatus Krumholzibacteriia bacterium]|nr:dihydroorotate dehydrogenase-like protein [bacterium]MCB9513000.1 dihydroorotate dehydrogenase-like protein [Candidatus Latescibacterota bacterium]MCB9516339.1 dihydroorotate dehydrogenase-like protein [Candidatus Latescibacterota bacterium]